MSNVTNLNRFRKAKERTDRAAQADANAAFHGLTKAQKQAARAEEARKARDLDGKKR